MKFREFELWPDWIICYLSYISLMDEKAFTMPPTSKKLVGHIASGVFIRQSVRPFVTLFDT